jgi:hypothetical protein
MKTLEQTVAGPKLSPGAAFALVGRTMGDLDYQYDKDRAYIRKGRGTDYGEHAIVWKENNKININDYYRKAYSSIPEPKGMEEPMRRSLQKSYGYEPRVLSSTEAPAAGARTSPGIVPEQVAPVRVNSLEEARKLGKGTKFIDPNGILREVP